MLPPPVAARMRHQAHRSPELVGARKAVLAGLAGEHRQLVFAENQVTEIAAHEKRAVSSVVSACHRGVFNKGFLG